MPEPKACEISAGLLPIGRLRGEVLAASMAATSVLRLDVLLTRPAAWSVPLAIAVMVGVSLATRRTVPAHTPRLMVRLHTPEAVVLDRG